MSLIILILMRRARVTGSRVTKRSQREVNLSGMFNLGADFGRYADIRSTPNARKRLPVSRR